MAWLGDNVRFLFTFLRSPKAVGSIVPSSRWLAARMVADMGLREAGTVVELGPGTGVFTKTILHEVGPSTLFLAVELNGGFAESLTSKYPGLRVVNGSAENLGDHLRGQGRSSADCILSSLPWTMFPENLQKRILDSICGSLRPGGRFATYAYLHAAWLPTARRFRRLLEQRFSKVRTTRAVWFNVPPAVVYRCEK